MNLLLSENVFLLIIYARIKDTGNEAANRLFVGVKASVSFIVRL